MVEATELGRYSDGVRREVTGLMWGLGGPEDLSYQQGETGWNQGRGLGLET